jgi:hypothetical protein
MGPGLRTPKSSTTIFFKNLYLFVVGASKSKVAKVKTHHINPFSELQGF